jgi:hypothetical protein
MNDERTIADGKASRTYQIIAAVIGAAATLLAAGWMILADRPTVPSQDIRITGRVSNAQTDEPVRKATVSLEARGIPQHTESDSKGIFSASVEAGYSTLRVRVSARGFEPFDELLPRDPANQLIAVALEPQKEAPRSSTRRSPTGDTFTGQTPSPAPVVRASVTSMLNNSLRPIAADADSWAVLLFGDQERRDDVLSSVRSALSGGGHDTVSLFRKVSDEQRLAPEFFRGSSDHLRQLDAGRYCSRILTGKLVVVPIGTTEGITIARATLSVRVVSPEGDLLRSFDFAEKGGGEDDSSARRHAVDELIETITRELPAKIE